MVIKEPLLFLHSPSIPLIPRFRRRHFWLPRDRQFLRLPESLRLRFNHYFHYTDCTLMLVESLLPVRTDASLSNFAEHAGLFEEENS